MKPATGKKIAAAMLVPLIFGFILFGSHPFGGGASLGIQSSNKVIAPSFLGSGFAGTVQFSSQPLFRPSFRPAQVSSFGSFRLNFFDP